MVRKSGYKTKIKKNNFTGATSKSKCKVMHGFQIDLVNYFTQ